MSAHDPDLHQAPPITHVEREVEIRPAGSLADVLARKEPELLAELQRLFALERLVGEMSGSEAMPR